MRDRDVWLSRLKSIEREAVAMRVAAALLREQARDNSAVLSDAGIGARDLELAIQNREGTYTIRLFAEFEIALRTYWAIIRPTHPRTRDLIDGLAAYRDVLDPMTAATHTVRLCRNSLVHEQAEDIQTIPLALARGILCRFLSRLPDTWPRSAITARWAARGAGRASRNRRAPATRCREGCAGRGGPCGRRR